jgi:geranylgeranyl diphosphate synthase, type II
MAPPPIKARLEALAAEVDSFLRSWFRGQDIPPLLTEAMDYSLLAGGKRMRPALCMSWAEMLGTERGRVLPFAAGIECIHTYSLIHDDLPAMDNDDLRRGRPTSHRKFGEATAILAGDGLLTEAFTLMLGTGLPPERVVAAAAEVATAAGPRGMVGGQLLDMELTGRPSVDLENLKDMHSRKTGALIMASCLSGALLAGSGRDGMERAEAYGRNVGLAFQVVDDILDVIGDESSLGKPVGSDAAQGKSTYPALIGLDGSYAVARQCVGAALEALEGFDSDSSAFLRELSVYIVDRIN